MSEHPFFSIVIPTYNRASMISVAIESVLAQTFHSLELIIIDDASTDNTFEVISSFKDARIKYYKNKTNLERSASRNRGIDLSVGRFICFLDSDDYFLPEHLALFYNCIEHHSFSEALYFCNTCVETAGKLEKDIYLPWPASNNVEFVLSNIFGPPRTCIAKTILTIHKFNTNLIIGEDRDLWPRIVKDFPIFHNDNYTVAFLEHSERTVNLDKVASYTDNFKLSKNLIKKYRSYVSLKARAKILSGSSFALARVCSAQSLFIKMTRYLFVSFYYLPFDKRNKEKIFMFLTGLKQKFIKNSNKAMQESNT